MKLAFAFVLIISFSLATASEDDGASSRDPRRARRKDKNTSSTCPTKCELNKKIEDDNKKFSASLHKLQRRVQARENNQNLVTWQELGVIKTNLSRRLERAIEGMFTFVEDNQKLNDIREKTRPCCAEEAVTNLRENFNNITEDINNIHQFQQNTANLVGVLSSQYTVLLKNFEELQKMNSVLKNQSETLEIRNNDLQMRLDANNEKVNNLENRLTTLEDFVANDNCTCDYVQVGLLSAAMEPPLILGSQSITTMERNQREQELKLEKIEDWVKTSVDSVSWLPTLEPPVNPMLQGNIEQAPRDCFEIFHMGFRDSGRYKIQPDASPVPFEVFCEQRYNGGGWTVFQRRRDGSVSFDRSYEEYAGGFGDVIGEYWLGLDKLHHLLSQGPHTMHVAMQDWNNDRKYAEYDDFFVDTPRNSYMMRFGMYRGTAGDALRGTASQDPGKNLIYAQFSAREYDNDRCQPCVFDEQYFDSCSRLMSSGWWFNACADANLNGRYLTREQWQKCKEGEAPDRDCLGVRWNGGDPVLDSITLRAAIMMVRPSGGGY